MSVARNELIYDLGRMKAMPPYTVAFGRARNVVKSAIDNSVVIRPVFTVAKMRSLITWSLLFIPDRARHRLDERAIVMIESNAIPLAVEIFHERI